jgi:hypothetical protein
MYGSQLSILVVSRGTQAWYGLNEIYILNFFSYPESRIY